MPVKKFRRDSSIPFEGVKWTGDNLDEIQAFLKEAGSPGRGFQVVTDSSETVRGLPVTAIVYDRLHKTWIKMVVGDTVMRGIKGEHYPVDPEALAGSYEPWVDGVPAGLLSGPFVTVQPGDKIIVFLAPDSRLDDSWGVGLLETLEEWAPEVDWRAVQGAGFGGIVHVPAVTVDPDVDEKPL